MRKELALIIFVGIIVFLAGCAKTKPTELQFKNDIITIPADSYFVSNLAPYSEGETSIQFDIHNNGDQKIPYLEVDFFDIPGFKVIGNSLKCEPYVGDVSKVVGEKKCVFEGDNAIEPLDVRSITIRLESTEKVSSPTPHTVSFAVRYIYYGSGEVSIPVIDGQTRKQPLTKLRESDPSVGPIVLEMDPMVEREVTVGGKTIKEYWGVGGSNPLPFVTKLNFKHVGTLDKTKDINITLSSFRINYNGLTMTQYGQCDFCFLYSPNCDKTLGAVDVIADGSKKNLQTYLSESKNNFYIPFDSTKETFQLTNVPDNPLYSKKSVLVPFDTLICEFTPKYSAGVIPEYSATISAFFAYKYEFIKSQDFVIQPLPK